MKRLYTYICTDNDADNNADKDLSALKKKKRINKGTQSRGIWFN